MNGLDCDDLDFPNQWELPSIRAAPDPTWSQHAACRGKPGEWWFPAESATHTDGALAMAICAQCPVQDDCLRHAIRENEAHGIWGGRSERQRARLRRAARRGAA